MKTRKLPRTHRFVTPGSVFVEYCARRCSVLLLVSLAGSLSCSGGEPLVVPVGPLGPAVEVVETTGDQAKLMQTQPSLQFEFGSKTSGFVITVDDSKKYQQMDGFGASLTDSAAWVVWNKLSPSQQSALWQSLFSPSAGIRISFLRQPMGATDFSASGNYSYDDVPAGHTDPRLTHFSIAHDTAYITPLLQRALAVNPAIKVVAVPWSPPAWMKTNGSMNGGRMNTEYFSSLAQYFVQFVQGYQQQGIPVYAIMAQNEPRYATEDYPSEDLPASDEARFIGDFLGPAMKSAGLGSVKIFGYDHNWDNTAYPETILAHSSASLFIAGSAFHCYRGDVSAQSAVKSAYPDKDIWFTECSGTTNSKFAGDLVWNMHNLMIGATRNWARSVSLWNLALDQNSGPKNGGCQNCRGVVTIDSTTSPATIRNNVEYYVLGHLAKFVVPGAYRVESNSAVQGGVEDVAFQNPDGSIVLLALNSGGADRSFTVSWKGEIFTYTLPGGAVATFVWKPARL